MIPLTAYHKNGYDFNLLTRHGSLAIFEQKHKSGKLVGYEVIKIRKSPATVMFGKPVAAHENCPSNEEWGLKGWTFTELDDAKAKLKVLERQREEWYERHGSGK